MESNLGYLEYEMCSLLSVTPKQLGELREKDSKGLAFLEYSFIHRKKKEYDEWKKREAERKSKARRPHRRH